MSSIMKKRAGFTLIELTITVAIIGILSASAIGLFRAQQMRAKHGSDGEREGIEKRKRATRRDGIYPAATAAPPGRPGEAELQRW